MKAVDRRLVLTFAKGVEVSASLVSQPGLVSAVFVCIISLVEMGRSAN